jgi:hypothetical protein
MNNHSHYKVIYDSVNFMRFSYNRYNPINEFANAKALVEEVKSRVKTRYNWDVDIQPILEELEQVQNISYGWLYDKLMQQIVLKGDASISWGEKTNLVWSKIPSFFEMFPHGRVIQIVRDPRAVLSSFKNFTIAPGNDYLDTIVNCIHSMNAALRYKELYKDKLYYCINYDELTNNPEKTLRALCDRLGLPFEENLLRLDNAKNKEGQQWKGNSSYGEKLNTISSRASQSWKTKLETWEIQLVELLCGDLMKEFGYELITTNDTVNYQELLQEILKSRLVSHGLLNLLLSKDGLERFPSDPLAKENWQKEADNYKKK